MNSQLESSGRTGRLRSTRVLLSLCILLMASVPTLAQTFTPIRINAGGPAYTDSVGQVWSADTGFNTGSTSSSTAPISGTTDPTLFQTNRWDSSSTPELQYSFPVPNGTYRVNLYFAENWSGAFHVGGRVFNVQVEGTTVLQSLDVYAQAGASGALIKAVTANVTDGQLDILFLHGTADNPLVSAIEILSAQVPGIPADFTATPVSPSQVNLSWSAALDDVGVTGYDIERCQGSGCSTFARIAVPVSTAYSDSGLAASTSYGYRIRARDGDGNTGSYSTVISATTASTAPFSTIRVNAGGSAYTDTAGQVWSADTGFNTGSTSSSTASISGTTDPTLFQTNRWDSSSTPELQYSFPVPNGTYQVNLYFAENWSGAFYVGGRVFSVQMEGTTVLQDLDVYAQAGANSALIKSTTVSVTDRQLSITFLHGAADNPLVSAIEIVQTAAADMQAPSVPTDLYARPVSATQADLYWSASSDDVAVTGYRIERCQGADCSDFTESGASTGTAFSDPTLAVSQTYRYRIRAADAIPNLSGYTAPVSVTTSAVADTQAPSAPTALTAIAESSTRVHLSWTASTDDVRVIDYRVERCEGAGCSGFVEIGTSTLTTFNDTGAIGSATYNYRVRAADAVPNLSDYSGVATVITPPAADIEPPTTPSGLSATPASGGEIDLAWAASTDNVAVAGYLIERCAGSACTNFSQVGTSSSNAYSDTGLAASTTYQYRIRAIDAENNTSGYSAIAAATTFSMAGKAGSVSYEYDSFGRLKRVTVVPH